MYRSDIKRRTPFHFDKNTTVNMTTLATKKNVTKTLFYIQSDTLWSFLSVGGWRLLNWAYQAEVKLFFFLFWVILRESMEGIQNRFHRRGNEHL